MNAINRQLGEVLENQRRSVEDRREVAAALGAFRDDIGELMRLGVRVKANDERIAEHATKIVAIEAWRQRKIGAAGLLHTLGALAGAVLGSVITLIFNRH